jgi:hypothetical protein
MSKRKLTREHLRTISLASNEAGGLAYAAKVIMQMVQEAVSKLRPLKTRSKKLKVLAVSLEMNPKQWKLLMRSMSTSSNSLLRES